MARAQKRRLDLKADAAAEAAAAQRSHRDSTNCRGLPLRRLPWCLMAKKRQTFGKMIRERERAERARKQEKKDARKAMIEAGIDPAEDPYAENARSGAAGGRAPSPASRPRRAALSQSSFVVVA